MISPKSIQWQDCEVCWLRRSMSPATHWDSTSTWSQYRLEPKILRSWKLNGSTHPKNAIFHPKDATQTSVEGVHRVPISIRTYGVLGPSEENVLHTNSADPRVQDNPSFSTQMVPTSKIFFIYFLGPNGKWMVLHVTNVCLRHNDDQSKKQQCFLKNCEVFRLPRTTGARIVSHNLAVVWAFFGHPVQIVFVPAKTM